MKKIWLVGESLPLREFGVERKASKTEGLPTTLVPLDPRHGVFPNLVMKPLFAAGYSLSLSHPDELLRFFQEMKDVVSDHSLRRFNLFNDHFTSPKGRGKDIPLLDPSSDFFEFNDATMTARICSFDLQNDLWLIFGHQTNFGLLWWLIDRTTAVKVSKTQIKEFSKKFANLVGECACTYAFEDTTQLTARIGLLHRLCTGVGTQPLLEAVITKFKPAGPYTVGQITNLLRTTIPLLHNEGYQDGSNPTGNAQRHFVRFAKSSTASSDLYWQVMGNAIANRTMNNFVE